MREFMKLAGTLTAIALVASLGLSAAYNSTHAIKEQYDREEQENARRDVLPGAEDATFEEVATDSIVNGAPFTYYVAKAPGDGEPLGYTFIAYGKGYSSTIVAMVGVDEAFTVTGVRIISQRETPGLGTKVQEVLSKNTLWQVLSGRAVKEIGVRPWFEVQFEGRGGDGLRVVKTKSEDGIQAITGATISSEAVTGSVRRGLAALHSAVQRGAPGSVGQPGAPGSPGSSDASGVVGEGAP